jgi:hypothetical protein
MTSAREEQLLDMFREIRSRNEKLLNRVADLERDLVQANAKASTAEDALHKLTKDLYKVISDSGN